MQIFKHQLQKNQIKFIIRLLILFLIPFLLIFTFTTLNSVRGPYFLGVNSDPDYAYLFNSLLISELKAPYHIDHPGTTLQVLGGIFIRAKNITNTQAIMEKNVFINSERYLYDINLILLTILIFAILLSGIYTFILTHNIILGLIIQATTFSSSFVLVEIVRVRPEYLIFSNLLIFSLILISLLKFDIRKYIYKYIIAFSIVSGFGLATKINYIPILIIPLLVIPRLKNKFLYIIGLIISFVLFTFPIFGEYQRVETWITSLSLHSGTYGSGPSEIIDKTTYLSNFLLSFNQNPIFSYILYSSAIFAMICIFIPHLRKLATSILEYRVLVALVISQILGVLIVSKHYSPHYLIPILMLSGVELVFLLITVQKVFEIKFYKVLYIAFVIVLILFSKSTFDSITEIHSTLHLAKETNLDVINNIDAHYPEFTKIYYYSSSSHEFALKFGNDFSGNSFAESLNKVYPNRYFYNVWNQNYYDFKDFINFEDIVFQNSKILFEGVSFEKFYKDTNFKPKVKLNDVYKGKVETIYIYEK